MLIPNFERAYPNITVNVTYATTAIAEQLETTELGAGQASDLLYTMAGCGTPISLCLLVPTGHLAPLLKVPWAKRSLPLVTSLAKEGPGLYGFEPEVSPAGIFTNDALFKKLGLQVPQTFPQLLDVCQKAKAAGTSAVLLGGAGVSIPILIMDLAVGTVYGQDSNWTAQLKAGTVTFDSSPGWHQALQEFVDMNNAGCFQPGAAGTTTTSTIAEFAQGQGLMIPLESLFKGQIDAAGPQFPYSFHPFLGGASAGQTTTWVYLAGLISINTAAGTQNQVAAREFINFLARPKQNALYTQITGGLTQYQFLKGQIPSFMSSFATVFANRNYIVNPINYWWNPNVLLALDNGWVGLITGQSTIDGILNAMDAAWKQGPA